jgi:anti-sigma-K factor RskA
MNYRDPQLRQQLAAEYVLGTLQGAARLRFERLLRDDARLRADVDAWEQRLGPLLLRMGAPVTPPARVWAGIRRHLFGTAMRTEREHWWFWRPLALGSAALAAALLFVIGIGLFAPAPIAPPMLAAVLQDDKSQSVWLVSFSTAGDAISVKTLTPQALTVRQAFELWLVPGDGKPRSLGLISPTGATRLALPKSLQPALVPGAVLAVSLEPAGGSPTGAPTGPVLYQGKWQSIS